MAASKATGSKFMHARNVLVVGALLCCGQSYPHNLLPDLTAPVSKNLVHAVLSHLSPWCHYRLQTPTDPTVTRCFASTSHAHPPPQSLDLSSNQLSGTLPDDWQLPESLEVRCVVALVLAHCIALQSRNGG